MRNAPRKNFQASFFVQRFHKVGELVSTSVYVHDIEQKTRIELAIVDPADLDRIGTRNRKVKRFGICPSRRARFAVMPPEPRESWIKDEQDTRGNVHFP